MVTFELTEAPGMTIFIALNRDPGETSIARCSSTSSAAPASAVAAGWSSTARPTSPAAR